MGYEFRSWEDSGWREIGNTPAGKPVVSHVFLSLVQQFATRVSEGIRNFADGY